MLNNSCGFDHLLFLTRKSNALQAISISSMGSYVKLRHAVSETLAI